ncbi:MAG: serine--tRNA ligase [Candidatus Omnitrophica bacterium]|jgi:seryl-tRNA synthetase|nr:serine--tRNA ligase [Candidatus Omnitrophota bacterium]MDD5661429.1 serine--tRNA ligase [Candidatus Omnitrophota bacterium]
MLDIKFIRENQDLVKQSINRRALKIDIDSLIIIDDARRKALAEFEELASKRNKANDEISILLKEKKDAKAKISSMKEISKRIGELDADIKDKDMQLNKLLLNIPNVAHASLPTGDAACNKIVRSWGDVRKPDFKPLNHIEICQNLDIVDFNRATKITGSNFILFKGWGAKLERALINFMLDLHTDKHGYTEIFPPFLVNRASMLGTGQLPKLEEDMYKLKDDDLFLIPTAEVPVTNIFRDEILEEDKLPIYYTAYTACFRREAGSYGKDTRGLVRVHEFDKVEMVKFVRPEDSFDELEKLVANAEAVLQLLELPYRLMLLATQDLSFAASKCYDIEVYVSGSDKWLEVSSCSNFESFQARRANIRFRRKESKKIEFLHTLNGSGVALARVVVAILENYQQEDGSVLIPKALQPYLNGQKRIF